MKRCSKCHIEKDSYEFEKNKYHKDGLSSQCKNCRKEYREKNKDKKRKYDKNYSLENKEKIKKRGKERHIIKSYDITMDEYDSLMSSVNYKCEICGSEIKLCIDHNHLTGKIRGIVCSKCNTILGMSGDNIKTLINAIEYLKERNG